jgi:hypothetical protein
MTGICSMYLCFLSQIGNKRHRGGRLFDLPTELYMTRSFHFAVMCCRARKGVLQHVRSNGGKDELWLIIFHELGIRKWQRQLVDGLGGK